VATTRPTRPAPMTMMMREAVKEMKFLRLRMCEVVKERESKRDAFLIYIYILYWVITVLPKGVM
jgi:hypothetical protein